MHARFAHACICARRPFTPLIGGLAGHERTGEAQWMLGRVTTLLYETSIMMARRVFLPAIKFR